MKRLVYAPRAYAFVKTERHGIVNLSNFITSGRVERKVGMVSSAELTLRNPQKVFTRGVSSRKGPYFHPMDPITIWLERIRGYPVQVFSGYLDVTPYLQLYPGTVTIEASCTLKRLLHTYWDPALPFSRDFLSTYGWWPGGSGIINLPAEGEGDELLRRIRQAGGDTNVQKQLDDGSIGNLLFAVLKHIVEWNPKQIHIEKLPNDLIQQVADIFEVYNEDARLIRRELEGFIQRYIGDGQYGGSSMGDSGPLRGGGAVEKAFNFFLDKGWTAEQAAGALGGMMFESGGKVTINPKAVNGIGCVGIAQWCFGRRDTLKAKDNWDTLEVQLDFLWHELQTTENETLRNMKKANTLADAVLVWARDFERAEALYLEERMVGARSAYESFKKNANDRDYEKELTGSRGDGVQDQPASRGGATADKIYSPFAGGSYPVSGAWGTDRGDHIHSGIDMGVPCGTGCIAPFDGTITHTSTSGFGTAGGMIHLRADKDVAGLNKGDKIGWGHVSAVSVKVGDRVKAGDRIATSGGNPCHVHFVYITAGKSSIDGTDDPTAVVKALMRGEATQGTTPNSDGTGGGGGTTSFQDVLSTAKAAAFVQDLEWPGIADTIEAIALTGPKSLMNDKPVLPFIEQLTGASMRNFQSLPNGDFFAFYPDYFGHMNHRKPYWNISDIEILDGGIQLSDEALATHVFGVGDTSMATPGIGQFERMMTTGVVNIFNVWQSGFTPQNETKDNDGEREDARSDRRGIVATNPQEVINFLKKYGARPHVEEAPFIRSPIFEAFMAHQTFNLMWSRLFLTNFQFTFMPELYPGGLVGLPEHGLQLYIDGVTHSFDYEAGFTTEAALSAPASLDPKKLGQDPLSFGLVRAAVSK